MTARYCIVYGTWNILYKTVKCCSIDKTFKNNNGKITYSLLWIIQLCVAPVKLLIAINKIQTLSWERYIDHKKSNKNKKEQMDDGCKKTRIVLKKRQFGCHPRKGAGVLKLRTDLYLRTVKKEKELWVVAMGTSNGIL